MLNRILLLCASVVCLSGCTTQRQTFEGHDVDEVWTAMLAVARTPDYSTGDPADRWTVRENRVWVDPGTNRMEIFRRTERILYRPASHPQFQEREWKLNVELEERDPPTVKFQSRGVGVPSHAWREADRYFAEVRDVLEGAPVPAAPTAGDQDAVRSQNADPLSVPHPATANSEG